MRIAYVDMVGGAAGDMLLGAFLDAGLDRDALERALRSVVAEGWTLAPRRVVKRGVAATYAGLVVPGEDGDAVHHHHRDHHHHTGRATRTLDEVLSIVERSGLTARQRERASAVYRRLAAAEALAHGTDAAGAFHAIGPVDAILDVAATCVALDLLEIEELHCSPFPVGTRALPPATAELVRDWPLRRVDVDGDLVTTTAAAILTTLAIAADAPAMTVERTGCGAGTSDYPIPNVTRIVIGTIGGAAA